MTCANCSTNHLFSLTVNELDIIQNIFNMVWKIKKIGDIDSMPPRLSTNCDKIELTHTDNKEPAHLYINQHNHLYNHEYTHLNSIENYLDDDFDDY